MHHLSTGLAVVSLLFATAAHALDDIEELLDVNFVMKGVKYTNIEPLARFILCKLLKLPIGDVRFSMDRIFQGNL